LSIKKTKILLAIRSLDIGGAERLVLSLAEGFDKSRFEVAIVTMYNGTLDERIPKDVKLIKAYKTSKYGYYRFLQNLRNVFEEFQPDIIYTHLGEMNLFACFLKPFLIFKPKIIWCFHSAYLNYTVLGMLSRIIFLAQKMLSCSPSRIVCVSDEVKRYHGDKGFCKQNMTVIDNGVDTKKFAPDSSIYSSFRQILRLDNALVIGISARLDAIKGYEVFAKAARILLDEGMNIRLAQMGGGDKNIKLACEKILGGYAGRFLWFDSVTEPQNIYPAFDIAVSASLGEAFSLSIAEAMSCGVPVVATDVGVFRQLVGSGGVVVAPNDAEALAEGIRKIAGMNRANIGMAGRAHIIQNYSLEKTVQRTQELFEEVLK
jgi:glycosyltransferase involved in cell wall biosynthesis